MNATRFLRFLQFLFAASPRMSLLVAGAGVLSGLLSAGLVAVLNRAVHAAEDLPVLLLVALAVLALGKIAMNALSQALLLRFAQTKMLELCLDLCRKILAAPLRRLEERGPSSILTTLTDDVLVVAAAFQHVPTLFISVAVLLGCSVYLAWLSWQVFLGMVLVSSFGVLIYRVLHQRAFEAIRRVREARETLLRLFRNLTEGLKELKMHRQRRETFVSQDLQSTAECFKRYNILAGWQYGMMQAWMQLFFYGMVVALLFSIPLLPTISPELITGYVFAALYMMGPFHSVLSSLPTLGRAQVSLTKIEELGVSLSEKELAGSADRGRHDRVGWTSLQLRGVTFAYTREAGAQQGFSLGPIDLELRPGEIVFVLGGNGSGKTTLVKLMSGLYVPDAGQVVLDGEPVLLDDLDSYRDLFSVVFSDCHVFERLLGLGDASLDSRANAYLERLKLESKVSISQGTFSTIALSRGQVKRLALLTAYLEDRPIYVFDEWAADQDPYFKEVFYRELLPELKARGKGIVVVTHDDRYFDMSDRVIKMEDGRLVGSCRRLDGRQLPASV